MTLALSKTIAFFRGSGLGTPATAAETPSIAPVASGTRVVLLDDIEALSAHVDDWERLAEEAAEPNCFYEHWMLLPALALLRSRDDVRVAMVFHRERERAPERLIGLFPLEVSRGEGLLRPRTVRMWKHRHCYLCTPLIHRDAVSEAWRVMLRWVNAQFPGAVIDFPLLAADGEIFDTLSEQCDAQRVTRCYRDFHSRAMLDLGCSAQWYLQSRQIKSNMKTWSRLRRRLEETGEVTTRRVTTDIDAALSRFLDLEASGWKGRGGTALACSPEDKAYFVRTSRAAFVQKRLLMYELLAGDRVIASQTNVIAGEGAFALKVAYDEQYARYSPGMLLEVEAIHHLHGEREVRWVDSCTAPTNRTMKRLWQQRRSIAQIMCAPRNTLAGLALSVLPLMRHVRQMARDMSGRASMLIGGVVPQELAFVGGCGVI